MLSETDQKLSQELKQRVKKIISIIDFRVYGSRARGDYTAYSDLDIFIIVPSITPKQRDEIFEAAWEIGFEKDRIISTFVVTQEQLTKGPLSASPILHKIESESIPV